MLKEKALGELVSFETKDRLTLHGFLTKSRSGNKTVIIHIHGMTGDFYRATFYFKLIKALKGSSYDLFSVNTRGFGFITRAWKGKEKIVIGTANEKFEECVIDIEAAMKAMHEIGYTGFILSGHSTGCQKITYYQAKKQNPKVKALLELSPGDDYNLTRIRLGKSFEGAVQKAKKMVKSGKGDKELKVRGVYYSAKRFLSYADPKNAEAQLFNYFGKLKAFSTIKQPILVTFGEKDHFAYKTAKEIFYKLKVKTSSAHLETKMIPKAEHSYMGQEKALTRAIVKFLKKIG